MGKNWIHKFKLKIRHFDNKVLFNFGEKYLENKAIPIGWLYFIFRYSYHKLEMFSPFEENIIYWS